MTIAAQFLAPRHQVPGPGATEIRELAHRALWVLPAGAHDVRALHGGLWITQDGDPRDIVLEAGQSVQTATRGRAVVYALSAARIAVQPALPQPVRHAGRRAGGRARGQTMALG